jgi:hypothetical protein
LTSFANLFTGVRARDLVDNPKNWRRHPRAQVDALRGLLAEVGFADALLARELPDKRLMVIDGHLRKKNVPPDALVPVLILDVTEREADKILLTLDPLASLAEADSERIKALLSTVQTDSDAVTELLRRTAGERLWEVLHPNDIREFEIPLDRSDELRNKWGTETGQRWQIGPHRSFAPTQPAESHCEPIPGSGIETPLRDNSQMKRNQRI